MGSERVSVPWMGLEGRGSRGLAREGGLLSEAWQAFCQPSCSPRTHPGLPSACVL